MPKTKPADTDRRVIPLYLGAGEYRALKIEAATTDVSMNEIVRAALANRKSLPRAA